MWQALSNNWPEYCMEAAELAVFMISACLFAVLLEHPGSPARKLFQSPLKRRLLMGLAMGLTAVALIYSPWGQRSGAHMNPATTLTFWLLGRVASWDAIFYVLAQFVGGAIGEAVAWGILRETLRHPAVNFLVTSPLPNRRLAAWWAEWAISFAMMAVVLIAANRGAWSGYTGFFAGLLLVLYITFEAPVSGMSLNPARTFGSALIARQWNSYWIYVTAPILGMLSAAGAYAATAGTNHVYCGKLCHAGRQRCIFLCRHAEMIVRSHEFAQSK